MGGFLSGMFSSGGSGGGASGQGKTSSGSESSAGSNQDDFAGGGVNIGGGDTQELVALGVGAVTVLAVAIVVTKAL